MSQFDYCYYKSLVVYPAQNSVIAYTIPPKTVQFPDKHLASAFRILKLRNFVHIIKNAAAN